MVGLRFVSIALGVIGAIVWIAWALSHKRYGSYAVAPVLYIANVLVFNVVLVFGLVEDPYALNVWSSAIRIQALFGLIMTGGWFLAERKVNGRAIDIDRAEAELNGV
jgi:hypothetical protein